MIQELQTLVNDSEITDEEKAEISEVLSAMDESIQQELVSLAAIHDWLIPFLYVNFASKKYAVSKGDPRALESVLRNEEEVLEYLFANNG